MDGALPFTSAAVLLLSERTLDRIIASLHQNDGQNPSTPSIPHGVTLSMAGGITEVQIGVPRVRLVDRATDSIGLQARLRIRHAAEGADAVHLVGTFDATMVIERVNPGTRGWRSLAPKCLWLRWAPGRSTFVPDPRADDLPRLLAALQSELPRVLGRSQPAPVLVHELFRGGPVVALARPGAPGSVAVPVGGGVVAHGDGSLDGAIDDADFAVVVPAETFVADGAGATWRGDGSIDVVRAEASGADDQPVGSVRLHLDVVSGRLDAVYLGQQPPSLRARVSEGVRRISEATDTLVAQLGAFDDRARVVLEGADFRDAGVVLRGRIGLADRRLPVKRFDRRGDALSAFETWVPAGNVDRITWSWSWSDGLERGGEASLDDRFVLGGRPLPGIHGPGRVSVHIAGTVVDPVTGDLTPLLTLAHGERFAFLDIVRPPLGGRLFVREWDADRRETSLLDVTRYDDANGAANTLAVHLGRDGARSRALASLTSGLASGRRRDTGLLVLALVDERSARDVPSVAAMLAGAGVRPAVVSEDVDGSWATAFSVDVEPTWLLLNSSGSVVWRGDGDLAGPLVATALEQHADRCGPPGLAPVNVDLGPRLRRCRWFGMLLDRDDGSPRWSQMRVDVRDHFVAVAFVRAHSTASEERLRQLAATGADRSNADRGVVLVVDGADDDEAASLARSFRLGHAFTVVGDVDGARGRAVGVRSLPTTVTLENRLPPA